MKQKGDAMSWDMTVLQDAEQVTICKLLAQICCSPTQLLLWLQRKIACTWKAKPLVTGVAPSSSYSRKANDPCVYWEKSFSDTDQKRTYSSKPPQVSLKNLKFVCWEPGAVSSSRAVLLSGGCFLPRGEIFSAVLILIGYNVYKRCEKLSHKNINRDQAPTTLGQNTAKDYFCAKCLYL